MHTYNTITTRALLRVVERSMSCGVIFGLAEHHIYDANSATIRALDLHSLPSSSFTVYYLALE